MIAWNTLIDSSVAARLSLAIAHSLWQVGLLAGGLWLVERFWKRLPLEAAYAAYVAALVVSLAAVPITFARLDVARAGDVAVAKSDSVAAIAPQATPARSIENDGAEGAAHTPAAPAVIAEPSAPSHTARPTVVAPSFDGAGLRQVGTALAPWIAGLYACGVLVMLVRIVNGVRYAQRLRASATLVADGPLAGVLKSLAAGWRLRVVPALAHVEGIAVPKVIGLVRPTILLPLAATSGVSAQELEMILAHELAHVRRYDLWVNLLQRLAEALLFFNPALWFVSRRISALREFCCDELTCKTLAAQWSEPRVRYAQALVHVAELAQQAKSFGARANLAELASLAASGNSPSELRRRVARLLGEPLREPLQLSRGGVLVLAAIAALLLVGPALSVSRDAGAAQNGAAEVPGVRKLADGSQVELLAIGTHQEQVKLWWDSEGAPLDKVPFQVEGGKVSGQPGWVARELVMRIDPLPADATVLREVKGFGAGAFGNVVDDGNKDLPGYLSYVFNVAQTKQDFNLRVGVAAGNWETLASADPRGGTAIGLKDSSGLIISEALTKGDSTVVVVSHTLQDRDTRVVAIDKQGRTHTAAVSKRPTVNKANQSQFEFQKLPPDEIEKLEFQARDFEWVTFDKLPVYPRDEQSAAAEKAVDPPMLRGRVQDDKGQPIAGADVGLVLGEVNDDEERYAQSPKFEFATQSDAKGDFEIPLLGDLPKQWGTVWAHAKGYGPARMTPTGVLTAMSGNIELEAAERMQVKLLDAREQPVADAAVRVLHVQVKDSVEWPIPEAWQDRFATTSDANGIATIASFVPGSLQRLRVVSDASGRVEYTPDHFLNVEGQPQAPHFTFTVPDAGTIEGELPSSATDAPRDLQVKLSTEMIPPFGAQVGVYGMADVTADKEGKFVVPKIAAGKLTAKIILAKDSAWRANVPTTETVVADGTTHLSIPLERGVLVRGQIRKQDTGAGYPNFALAVIFGPSAVTHDDMNHKTEVKTDKDGRYSAYVPPGPIELRLHSAPRDYHHVEWWGGRSKGGVWGSRREVPAGVAEFDLDPIELVPAEEVKGKLVDKEGKPLVDWTVYGFPAKNVMNSFSGVNTEKDGGFSGHVPTTYPPSIWEVAQRVKTQGGYGFKDTKYQANVISGEPLVLEVGDEIRGR